MSCILTALPDRAPAHLDCQQVPPGSTFPPWRAGGRSSLELTLGSCVKVVVIVLSCSTHGESKTPGIFPLEPNIKCTILLNRNSYMSNTVPPLRRFMG